MDRRRQSQHYSQQQSGLDEFELHYLSLGSEPADTGAHARRPLRYQNRYFAKRQVLNRVRRMRRSQLDEE
jgi:hypothetical protein